jgi:hypothetical protein
VPEPSLHPVLASFAERMRDWWQDNPQAADAAVWWLQEMVQPPPTEAEGSRGERMFRAVMPANWWHLSLAAQSRAREVMPETGLCLAWVPRPEIVRRLVSTNEKAQRDQILIEHAGAILDDAESVLCQSVHPQLAALPSVGIEAVHAFRHDAPRASQALCAAALGTLLADHFGETSFGKARERLEASVETVSLLTMRRVSIHQAIRYAILRSNIDPAPDGFNRHLTAHGVQANFTTAHALSAIMLIAGAVRELHELYTAGASAMHIAGTASSGA